MQPLHLVPLLALAIAGAPHSAFSQKPATPPPAVPNAGDPFVKGSAQPAPAPKDAPAPPAVLPHEGLIRIEYFSLPHTLARKVMRQFPQQSALYEWLGAELEKEQSEVKLERLSLLKVRGGQRSKLDEIDEYPYPSEFDPPQIPQSIGLGAPLSTSTINNSTTVQPAPVVPKPTPPPPKPAPNPVPAPGPQGDPGAPGAEASPSLIAAGSVPGTRVYAPWPYTTTTATSFQFKHTGWTHEVEMTIGEDGKTVDVNIAPHFVKIVGMVPQVPSGEIAQPLFETGRLITQILTKLGQPTLVGTISPAVATGAPGGNTANRTWLLFITVNSNR